MTEDPAIQAKALRESLASKGAQLSALIATTDHNGQQLDPEAEPVLWATDPNTGKAAQIRHHSTVDPDSGRRTWYRPDPPEAA